MHFEYKIKGGDFANAGNASSQVKKILKQLNVDHLLIKRVVVSLYEAEVNIVAHALEGIIKVDIDAEKIILRLEDKGPGIPDIPLAMKEGYSTASPEVRAMGFGAGMGLSNIKKNADKFNITSKVEVGTQLEIIIYFK
ncbi:MAG: ATP-binding protein [Bacteroidota bacterium]|nr:ATP-binding protein [Bacteroidota bacterium]MDP4225389.1 ATP-binding protein [Bacteroidota bacterium]MDP4273784.1 ATP-binding protein [Bacteroidota bacterium]